MRREFSFSDLVGHESAEADQQKSPLRTDNALIEPSKPVQPSVFKLNYTVKNEDEP